MGKSDGQQPEVTLTKRQLGKIEKIELARQQRDDGKQELGFSSRPFVLCGLPLRRVKGKLIHIRRNGKFFLRVAGDPEFGLPYGQDRLIPLWVSTLAVRQKSRVVHFDAAAQILEAFGLPKDGKTYRRLVEGFKRIFASTIYFGTESQLKQGAVWAWSRFHFFDKMHVWYSRDVDTSTLPGEEFRNVVVLSEAFWQELQEHPIPIDLAAVRALVNSPGELDLYTWLVWRCWKARGAESIPLMGTGGLVNQLGVEGYSSERKFRQTLKRWLASIRAVWPDCPATISLDGESLVIRHVKAIRPPKSSTPGV